MNTNQRRVPLRVDFAGGWLDVPRFARPGAYVVNCAISPPVSLTHWPYKKGAGLGGSGAWALLNGRDGVEAELDLGVGWQDPAVIRRTGLCVWESAARPRLHHWGDGAWLRGRMAVWWTGHGHDTPGLVDRPRDYQAIHQASLLACEGALREDLGVMSRAVEGSYAAQLGEGMDPLPDFGELARKYCGGGHGGYALYLFDERDHEARQAEGMTPVEPFSTAEET